MAQRIALITGGARGIGRAIAEHLATQSWGVAYCYRTSKSDAESLEETLRQSTDTVLPIACDVSDPDACKAMVDRVVRECGGIHALINCAGPYHRAPILDETIEGWHEMFDNNLHPVFYLSRMVAPHMTKAQWGRILVFSMANADRLVAQPQVTAHYIAKSALLILTRTLAKVLGPHNITVNAISPGFIDSDSAPAEELERMVKNIPAGYIGEVSDAVSAASYLLSEEARYVNGANLQLSGGWGV